MELRTTASRLEMSRAPKPVRRVSNQSEQIVTYLPDNSLRHGYLSLFKDIYLELVRTRWLTYQLFKRDVFAFYKQSLLGAFWIFFVPLVTVGTFIVLRGSGVVATGKVQAPYPVYAVLGIAVWQLFAQGLVAGANSLVAGGEMITRINFSKKSLIIASMGRTVVSFLVLVALFVVLVLGYRLSGYMYTPHAGVLLVPLTLVPTVLLTVGLSFHFALLNGVMRDIGTVLSMLVTFLMLLTPVLYERPRVTAASNALASFLDTMTTYNPLYYLVAAPRDLVLRGFIADVRGFMLSALASVVIFGLCLVGFHLTETRIAERI